MSKELSYWDIVDEVNMVAEKPAPQSDNKMSDLRKLGVAGAAALIGMGYLAIGERMANNRDECDPLHASGKFLSGSGKLLIGVAGADMTALIGRRVAESIPAVTARLHNLTETFKLIANPENAQKY